MATTEEATRPSTRNFIAVPGNLAPGTLVDLFLGAVDRSGAAPAQMFDDNGTWRTISHTEMYERVRSLSAAMVRNDVARGDNIALLSENRPEWAQIDYAAICAGAHTVPLYPTLPAQQLAFIINHAGAGIVFVSSVEQLAKLLEVRPALTSVRLIVVFDEGAPLSSGVVTLSSFIASANGPEDDATFRAEARRAQPNDVATIIYTSGTTGEPKGVMLSHNNLYSNVQACLKTAITIDTSDVALSFLPLSHVYQRMVDYAMFQGGATIAYVSAVDKVVAAMGQVHPTLAVAVPRVYEKIYTAFLSATGVKHRLVIWARGVAMAWTDATGPVANTAARNAPSMSLRMQHALADRLVFSKLRAKLGGRMRFFMSGGAPLHPDIARFFYGAGVLILEGYGLTETSPVTNANTIEAMRIGTVGQPIPGTEIRIADDGEILVRGPQVMVGYYHNEAATREAVDSDGWFHTGDIGSIDADGFLRITDRKKDLLVTAGGKNIAPQPIQNASKASRFISEALLVGDKRPYAILLAVPNFDMLRTWATQNGLDASDMAKLVKEPAVRAKYEAEVAARTASFARYEKPKKVLVLPHEFSIENGEMTPKMSIKRRVVEQHYGPDIEAMYAEPGHVEHHE